MADPVRDIIGDYQASAAGASSSSARTARPTR